MISRNIIFFSILEALSFDHPKSIPDFSCPGGVVSVEVRGGELEFGGGDGSL